MTPAELAGLAQSERSEVRALVAELRAARASVLRYVVDAIRARGKKEGET